MRKYPCLQKNKAICISEEQNFTSETTKSNQNKQGMQDNMIGYVAGVKSVFEAVKWLCLTQKCIL